MFLKFLDDLETQREGEAKLAGKKFKPAIEPPYRWRDWAAKSDGITGDDLDVYMWRFTRSKICASYQRRIVRIIAVHSWSRLSR